MTSPVPDAIPHEEWDPIYERIRDDFGFTRAADAAARDRLAALLDRDRVDAAASAGPDPTLPDRWVHLADRLAGANVAIVAPGPSLTNAADDLPDDVLASARAADVRIAASTAAGRIEDAGLALDAQVTDLDGAPAATVGRSRDGVPVAVHAHGDNRGALDRWAPQFGAGCVLPTTQVAPAGGVVNLGGFTDGDRAAFLAHAAGATTLRFVGWDLDDTDVGSMKRRKLDWAARLLRWLERRRGERFPLLDGRRSSLSPLALDGS